MSNVIASPQNSKGASLIEKFAEQQRLTVIRDESGEKTIRGAHGEISDFGNGEALVACFWGLGSKFSRTRARRIKAAIQKNYGLRWAGGVGGDEALILFSPSEERSAKFFVRAIGARRKRRVSDEVAARLRSFAKCSNTAAGEALQAAEALAESGTGITDHLGQVDPKCSPAAIKRSTLGGAQ
jgi:hypothetical protein